MSLIKGKISDSKIPTVSIGMPIFNDEKYVSRALDDLLSQTFYDFELIISDNNSTDKTEEICKKYASKDRRIRYYRQSQNIGPQANFNFVLHLARGEFFMWAASDDRWDKDFITILLDAIRHDESYTSSFCPYTNIDENDRTLGSTYKFDFSGRSIIKRIARFIFTLDSARDAFIYGIHRRNYIQDVKFPVWWWINAKVPMNTAHPMLSFFLARGGYILAGTRPLWFNRIHIHSEPRHSSDFRRRPLIGYLALLLQKVNVFYESVRSIYKGSGSIPVTIATVPLLATRCIYDCLIRSLFRCRVASNRILRKHPSSS